MDSNALHTGLVGAWPPRPGPRLATALVVIAAFTGAVQAQDNAGNVLPAVDDALTDYCQQNSDNEACALQGDPVRTNLAPDKFVMLGAATLSATAQQAELVQGRLSDLRGARSRGGPGFSFGPGRTRRIGDLVQSVGRRADGDGSGGALAMSFGTFARFEGEVGASDPTAFDPGFDRRATALTLGADYRLRPNLVLGAALGVRDSRSSIDTADGASYSTVGERGTSLSLFGSFEPIANAYADAIVSFGRSRFHTRRDIAIPALSLQDTAVGSTTSREFALSVGGGYAFIDGAWSWGPYGRLSHSRTRVDAFDERPNPTDTQLSVAAQSATSLLSGLGAQVSYASSQDWGVLVPNARIEWNHQFRRDRVGTIVATFAEAVDPVPMAIETTPPDRNHFTLDLGLAAHFGVGRSGALNYSAVLGRSGQSSHVFTAELRLEF